MPNKPLSPADRRRQRIAAKAAAAGPKMGGRPSKIPASLWDELRELWEGGDYQQRELADYAKSRGYPISQSRISDYGTTHGWVKNSRLKELRDEAASAVADRMGVELRDMLGRHSRYAKAMQEIALRHVGLAADQMRKDPSYKMPPNIMRSVLGTLRDAAEMEARAMGFDYNTGRPFAFDKNNPAGEGDVPAPVMRIEEYTAAELAEIEAQAEREHKGTTDDEDA